MPYRLAWGYVAAALCFAAPVAFAVTDGELDGNRHPNVGLMVALDAVGNPMWRCSGTLVSPRHYLTAGHCTYGATRVTITVSHEPHSDGRLTQRLTQRLMRGGVREMVQRTVDGELDRLPAHVEQLPAL